MITLCTHLSLILTDEEIGEFYKVYKSKQSNLIGKLKNIPRRVFRGLNRSTFMQRITNYQEWLGIGTGGIAIKATYKTRSGDPFVASIKIIPDNKLYVHFQKNLILAIFTGDVITNKSNPEKKHFVV
jgi:hypothetical protein